MSLGTLVRTLFGPRYFKYAGKIYRSFFVNLKTVYQSFPVMRPYQQLLDIGCGDGELINFILGENPLVKITMIDIAKSIGNAVDARFKRLVTLLPGTSIVDYREKHYKNAKIDFILISDVIHHIKPGERKEFFSDMLEIIRDDTKIIIKDVEPGHLKSYLAFLADKYISGDKYVTPVGKKEMIKYMKDIIPTIKFYETNLFRNNMPNYCLVFNR